MEFSLKSLHTLYTFDTTHKLSYGPQDIIDIIDAVS